MIFESPYLRLSFRDSDGCLTGLKNKTTGREYLRRADSWISFVFDSGVSDIWDSRPDAESAATYTVKGRPASFEKKGNSLTIRRTVAEGGMLVLFEEKLRFTEGGRCVESTLRTENRSEKGVLVSLRYPDLSGVRGGDDSLYWPIQDGSLFQKAFRSPADGSDFTTENRIQFRSTIGDNDVYTENVIVTNYPVPFSAQCCAVYNEKEFLYLGHHDKEHSYKQFGFEKSGKLYIRHWPFLAPGQGASLAPVCLAAGEGDWHDAADIYNRFRSSAPEKGPGRTQAGKNIRGMAIYQCVSFPSYYHLKYTEDAPARTVTAPADMSCRCLNADGMGSPDFDTFLKAAVRARDEGGSDLVLFIGWHVGGLDAWYPDYEPVKELGGKNGLREAIKEVHEAGMKAIFYVNVHIADRESKWFRHPGRTADRLGVDCAIKKPDGNVWIERYPGTSRQYFVAQCPMSDDWTKAAVHAMETVMKLGADGIYFDELMTMPAYLCYDRTHGHKTPATAFNEGYRRFFSKVYRMIGKYRPDDYICGCEGVGDAYDPYIDIMCMHWWRKWGNPKASYARPEALSYVMRRPMLGMQASGEIGDNMAGYAFSVFSPLLEHPYVYPTSKRLHALWEKYPEIYRDGTFTDTVGLSGVPAGVRAGTKRAKDGASLILHLYNTSYRAVTVSPALDAARLGIPAGLSARDAETGKAVSLPLTLGPKEKKAVLFRK